MTLREYRSMVPKDLAFDMENLDHESSRTAQVHNKYLNFYLDEQSKLEVMMRAFAILRHSKSLYYLGKADPEVYKEKPFDLKVRPIKSEIEQWLSVDPEIQAADIEIKEQERILKYLNDTVKQINNRGYEVKDMIKWMLFKNGMNTNA